jgi:hypothetical protein
MTKARSNAIAAAAKGDLTVGTGTNLSGILPVSSQNGDTIVADNSTSTGLRWQVPVNVNPVLNSAFQVWQRGTSISVAASSAAYTADRWYIGTNAAQAITVSRQVTGDTTNLPFIQYCQRIQRNSGQTGTAGFYQSQFFETVNSIPFAGKTITYSFYARAGANFSASSNTLEFYLQYGTGTDQGAGLWTGQASAIATSGTLTTTWQRFTATATLPTTATQIKVVTGYVPTGTAGANDYYELTGVQVEVGSVATPFKTYAGTIQGETSACQRYYFRNSATASNPYGHLGGLGWYTNATTASNFIVNPPVTMRTTPTSVEYGGTVAITNLNASSANITALALNQPTPTVIGLTATVTAVIGTYYTLGANNSATAYIGISAEL